MTMLPMPGNPDVSFAGAVPRGLQFDLPQKKPGMFGGKLGIGEAIVAALNGYLAGTGNPAGLANIRMMQEMAQQKRAEALAEQNDQRELQRQKDLYLFKLQNPEPPNNDTVNDYQFILQTLGPDAAKQYLQTKTNPITMTPYGPMPYSAVMAPQQPQILQSLPPGAKPIGGPTPQASGNFSGY